MMSSHRKNDPFLTEYTGNPFIDVLSLNLALITLYSQQGAALMQALSAPALRNTQTKKTAAETRKFHPAPHPAPTTRHMNGGYR